MDIWGACVSVHPPRETKTRRGADRRALGGRRASPCGGALVPLWGKSFPSWDFGVSAAAFAAAPRQHKPPSEETVERQDSDEAQTKGKTRMVKFITIRGTRALSATPYYKGHGVVRAEQWCCACAHCLRTLPTLCAETGKSPTLAGPSSS